LAVLGCGGQGAPPVTLADACQQYAEAGCKKNAECAPPAAADCVSKGVADCLANGNSGGASCVQTAANSIAGCVPAVETMTCDEYCSTSPDGFTFCYAPCIWLCP
jgi:hypothetical protein